MQPTKGYAKANPAKVNMASSGSGNGYAATREAAMAAFAKRWRGNNCQAASRAARLQCNRKETHESEGELGEADQCDRLHRGD
jgi:hypothetical protein